MQSYSLFDSVMQHLELTFVALFISVVVGVGLGIILHKMKNANKVVSAISAVQTIPTLALLGFLVPILGIGKIPAVFVLIVYGCYPIVINTYSGLGQVDSEYLEISDALGMSENQKLFKVKLPLSISVIMAGIRTGLVQIIGLATLTSLIGSGGLGDFIYRGINAMNNDLILLGAIPVTIIVLILSFLLKQVENNWNFFFRHKKATASVLTLIAASYVVVTLLGGQSASKVTLASKDFTESILLSSIMEELIEEKTDIDVETKVLGTTDIIHKALVKGEIHGYVEYVGTAYMTVFGQTELNDQMMNYVVDAYDEIGMKVIGPLGFENTFVVLQTQETLDKYNITSLSELSEYQNKFIFTSYAEYLEREDGIKQLLETYNLSFKDVKQLERAMGYKALAEGEVDFMISFSTEPAIFKNNFQGLEDDKKMFGNYEAFPVFSKEILEANPELEPLLTQLINRLDSTTMAKLNNEVENEQRDEKEVAREWLKSEGLIN